MEDVEVRIPDIGDFSDVPVIEVMVGPGDEVQPEDPLVTLESDKATMDVPAPEAGTVRELRVAVGDKVSQGSVVLTLSVDGDRAEANGGASAAAAESEPEPEAPASEPGAGSAPEVDTATAAQASDPPAGEAQPAPTHDKAAAPGPVDDGDADGVPYASPAVRRIARRLGVDLGAVGGSGRKGRITKADVEAQAVGGAEAGAPATDAPVAADGPAVPGLDIAPWPKVDFEKYGPVERVERSRIQRISGPNLARNWVMIPHVTHNDEADVTELEAFRKETNEANAKSGVKVTMVALLLKASVASLKAFPDFNASLDGDQLVRKRYYHLGFAADTPQGLLVPVIRDVDRKGILQLSQELADLSGAAREGKLKLGDMQGGTFTISSLGGIGGTSFTPIVNAPEVAILGVTRSAMKPVWNGSEFVPRLLVPLSLSYDHRVIDGAAAARFTAHLAGVLTDLRKVLL